MALEKNLSFPWYCGKCLPPVAMFHTKSQSGDKYSTELDFIRRLRSQQGSFILAISLKKG